MDIAIAFIEETPDGEDFVLTMYPNTYPTYKAGDIVFLQIDREDHPERRLKTTEFEILKVNHSVREKQHHRFKSMVNPLGIVTHMGMEVYVKRKP